MMKFDNSLGSLATAPFHLDKDELFFQDFDASDFDVNTKYDVFGGKPSVFDGFNIPTDLNSLFDDIDFEFFTDKFHPLDYLVDGKHNPDFQDENVGVPSPLGSPISPIALDEFSFDLLEPVDTEELNIQFKMLENTPAFTDLFEEDLKCSEQYEIPGQSLRVETSSPMSTSSNHNNILVDHAYAKIPESDKDRLDLMSPKSVDSGISFLTDDEYQIPDEFIADVWEALGLPGDNKTRDDDIGINEVPAKPPNDGAITSSSPRTRYSPYPTKKEKTEDEKLRRKEHNRKSASKYRSKKKEKLGTVLNQVEQFEKKNKELKTTVEELQSEIDYLKGLMKDVICARFSKKKSLKDMAKFICDVNS